VLSRENTLIRVEIKIDKSECEWADFAGSPVRWLDSIIGVVIAIIAQHAADDTDLIREWWTRANERASVKNERLVNRGENNILSCRLQQ